MDEMVIPRLDVYDAIHDQYLQLGEGSAGEGRGALVRGGE
jgi:hypothetical protein